MTLVLLLLALVGFLTWAALRGGILRPEGMPVQAGSSGIVLALVAVLLAMLLLGIVGGLALITTIVVHEFGHVAAFRVAGHADARFRLIPLVGGVAISKRRPLTDAHDLYITIMGPGICLVLMAGAAILAGTPVGQIEPIGQYLTAVALYSGALNFLNLLPIYPLDGGRIAAVTLGAVAPVWTRYGLIGVSGAILLYSIATLQLFLMILSLLSLSAARQIGRAPEERRLSSGLVVLGLAVWGLMITAFWIGGRGILQAQTGF
ncbi:MAG: site-2 protease family protein [Pseudomonadota bacterium]